MILKTEDKELIKGWNNAKDILDLQGEELTSVAFKAGGDSFLPRPVQNVSKASKKLPSGLQEEVELRELNKKKAKTKDPNAALTPVEKEKIASDILSGDRNKKDILHYQENVTKARGRTGEEASDLADEYLDPVQALMENIRSTTDTVMQRRLYGYTAADDFVEHIDVADGVKRLMGKDWMNNADAAATLKSLMTARFDGARRSPGPIITALKNIGLLDILATPKVALKQLGDTAVAANKHGVLNTAQALLQRTNGINVKASGLNNDIAVDVAHTTTPDAFSKLGQVGQLTAKGVDKALGWSGVKAVDGYGKTILMKAAANKLNKQLRSPKGEAVFRGKYREMLTPDELDHVVGELGTLNKKGGQQATTRRIGETQGGAKHQRSEAMRIVMFNEVAEVAPVTLGQQTEMFLNHPNSRALYTLKSYTIKQLNFLRDTTFKGAGQGNVKQDVKAASNVLKYALYMGTGNYAINEVRQALWTWNADPLEFNVGDLASEMVWQVLGTQAVLNSYNWNNQAVHGNWGAAAAGALVPSTGIIAETANQVINIMQSTWDEDEYDFSEAGWDMLKAMPSLGLAEQLEFIFGDERERIKERKENERNDYDY